MTRVPGVARQASIVTLALIAVAGVLYLLVGTGLAWAGVAIPDLVRAQIPVAAPVDSAAVGGAMVALGGLGVLVGLSHLLLIPGIRGARPGAVVTAIMGAATLCLIATGTAIGALVALAAGAGDASTMVPAAVGLGLAGAAYGWLVARLMALRTGARSA